MQRYYVETWETARMKLVADWRFEVDGKRVGGGYSTLAEAREALERFGTEELA